MDTIEEIELLNVRAGELGVARKGCLSPGTVPVRGADVHIRRAGIELGLIRHVRLTEGTHDPRHRTIEVERYDTSRSADPVDPARVASVDVLRVPAVWTIDVGDGEDLSWYIADGALTDHTPAERVEGQKPVERFVITGVRPD